MNWSALLLLGVGFLMIFLEFFLPGGIMGAIGALLVLISIVLFALKAQSALAIVLYVTGSLVGMGVLIWFAIWRIKTGRATGIFLNTAQEGYVASSFDKGLIGAEGEALSDLKPAGHILAKEKRYQAVSKTGYVVKGSKIVVVGGEGAHLIVKLKGEAK
ncbi:MAG: hypothetical protein S4CHLAM2_02470 [Chlamydiales bacterium]|nr:hypothetical protein [Chlamydiales bacterium]